MANNTLPVTPPLHQHLWAAPPASATPAIASQQQMSNLMHHSVTLRAAGTNITASRNYMLNAPSFNFATANVNSQESQEPDYDFSRMPIPDENLLKLMKEQFPHGDFDFEIDPCGVPVWDFNKIDDQMIKYAVNLSASNIKVYRTQRMEDQIPRRRLVTASSVIRKARKLQMKQTRSSKIKTKCMCKTKKKTNGPVAV